MKLIVPFDTSIAPPKRFWSALWAPKARPEDPETEFEIVRCSIVPGATDVLLDSDEQGRVSAKLFGACARIQRAFGSMGEWFVRRDAAEREEELAASRGLDAFATETRLRDAERSRHLRM